jgi:hypothetical protein
MQCHQPMVLADATAVTGFFPDVPTATPHDAAVAGKRRGFVTSPVRLLTSSNARYKCRRRTTGLLLHCVPDDTAEHDGPRDVTAPSLSCIIYVAMAVATFYGRNGCGVTQRCRWSVSNLLQPPDVRRRPYSAADKACRRPPVRIQPSGRLELEAGIRKCASDRRCWLAWNKTGLHGSSETSDKRRIPASTGRAGPGRTSACFIIQMYRARSGRKIIGPTEKNWSAISSWCRSAERTNDINYIHRRTFNGET